MIELLNQWIQHFHFLRPLWLLGVPLAILAIIILWRRQDSASGWQQLIAPQLLTHLMQGKPKPISRAPLIGLGVIWVLACVSMAGPSWEKLPQPIHKSEQALVILLDLSPSMLAQDLKPSRLVRARLKLIDFLAQRQEGLTALIAFAGESHVITPLTDDTRTITALVPALSPNIMPLAGSNPEMAVQQAVTLLDDAGIARGELLLITDGIDPTAIDAMEQILDARHQLSILGVGTETGAPIPISSGGFAKDSKGGMILARLNSAELQQLSRRQNGHYRTLAATNEDIEALAQTPTLLDGANTREINREFDLWQDRGPWLALLLLPLLLLGFRRGWLLCLMLVTLPNPQPAMALDWQGTWQDLWQTRDQQGQALLQAGDASAAAQTFEDSQWAGSAHYQAGEYEDAISDFAEQNTATADYNRGNALAKSGRLEEALKAYQSALEKDSNLTDAEHNRQLVEQALQQQQQQQQQQQNQQNQQNQPDDQGDSEGQGQQQPQSGQQNTDQQNGKQQQSPKDSGNQQSDTQQDQQSNQQQQQQQQQQQNTTEQAAGDDATESEQKQDTQQDASQDGEQPTAGQPMQQSELTAEQKEQQQAMEQWLRKVPDDPSGLMRKKFEYQYNQRRLQYQQGTWQPPKNNALERW